MLGGYLFTFPLLRARRRRIRERDRTRCDRNDVAVVVDGVDAVLQHLLGGTAWISSKRELVPRRSVRLSHAVEVTLSRLFTVMFEHRSNALTSTKLRLTSRKLRFSVRLLLAILGDERSGIGRAAGRGHLPVLAGAGLVAQIEF